MKSTHKKFYYQIKKKEQSIWLTKNKTNQYFRRKKYLKLEKHTLGSR